MGDQFRQLRPGEKIPGLPTQVWNQLLDMLKSRPGPTGPATASSSPAEVLVRNASGSAVAGQFGILKVSGPRTPYTAANAQAALSEKAVKGLTPVAGDPFVVLREPTSADGFSVGTLLGYTWVRVNLTDVAHKFADCTTATDKITSAASGPARILWVETDETTRATGDQWAVVNLIGATVGAGAWVHFTLPSALATTDASKAGCTVDFGWAGGPQSGTVTVWNMPASTNYAFSGASGNKGYATYDDVAAKWRIMQMQC